MRPMSRTLVIGDIHGRVKALRQVLSLAEANPKTDELVVLGDVADGDVTVRECFDELLKFNNLTLIRGNHDQWLLNWIESGVQPSIWFNQGGQHTLMSYGFKVKNVPESHKNLLKNSRFFYVNRDKLFVHGGLTPGLPMEQQDSETLMWNRSIIDYASNQPIPHWKKVFIGHTTTQFIGGAVTITTPLLLNNLVCLDTGAGWNGKLTLMDIDTFQFWQSDVQTPGPSKTQIKRIYQKTFGVPLSRSRALKD